MVKYEQRVDSKKEGVFMDPNQNPFQNDELPPVNLFNQSGRGRRMAITSMILGGSALLFLFLGAVWFAIFAGILAVVLSVISRKQAGHWSFFSIIGLVTGLLMVLFMIVGLAIGIYIVIDVKQDPTGEIAKLMDQIFLQNYGRTFTGLLSN